MTDANILHVYGLTSSLIKVSEQLIALNVSHSLVTKSNLRVLEKRIDLGFNQPAWPILVDTLTCINRIPNSAGNKILFVCDSLDSIKMCNIQQIKSEDLKNTLVKALIYAVTNPISKNWVLINKEPSIEDYIKAVTKPQILNTIQTFIYKIAPYSLRKEVQTLIISYLAGSTSKLLLKAKLESSYKLVDLLNLCFTEKADHLRAAVSAFNKSKNVEQVSLDYDIDSFQILYITRSVALAKN